MPNEVLVKTKWFSILHELGWPLEGVVPENHLKLATHRTKYGTQNKAVAKPMYIKLPRGLFFIWCLDLIILMRGNPLLGPLEGVGPEN